MSRAHRGEVLEDEASIGASYLPYPGTESSVSEQLTIGKLAKAARVHVETIRYYQRRGLMDGVWLFAERLLYVDW